MKMTAQYFATYSLRNKHFTDLQLEPNDKFWSPTSVDYRSIPLVTLEETIAPVKHLVDADIETKVYITKQHSKVTKDDLFQDDVPLYDH
jgi:hypothetical protein